MISLVKTPQSVCDQTTLHVGLEDIFVSRALHILGAAVVPGLGDAHFAQSIARRSTDISVASKTL